MMYLKHTLLGILILFVTVSSIPQSRRPSNRFAELQVSTTKTEYLLGEPVTLERRFIKIGDDPVDFLGDDRQGPLRVFISKGTSAFLRYEFPGWDLPNRTHLEGPGRYKVAHSIFFNKQPVTYHLSEYGRREAEEGRILTDYAFPEPGEYRLKATLGFSVRREGGAVATSETVESNEITIRVKQPTGDDLRVWEIMRADPKIGFFVTDGEVPYRVPSIRDQVLAEVDKIVADYPDSYLAGLLKVKAQEHRARRERK
jgi:hypothetical protein